MSSENKQLGGGLLCDKCNVYIPNEASLDAHLKGKKHIKNVERIKNQETEAERSLYIAGLEHLTAVELSLVDYFSKFGSISKITVDKNNGRFAILEFCESESAKRALQVTQHCVESKSIIVKSRNVKLPPAKKPASDQHHIVHGQIQPDVWNALMEANDNDTQFQTLQNKLSLTADDLHLRDLICQLLHVAFEEVFMSCKIQPFGSSVNGFGVHSCDLDLNFHYESVDYDAAIQFLNDDNKMEETSSTLDQNKNKAFTVKQVLTIVAAIIRQCVPDCHQVKAILSARRPVVKFYHKSSQMCCDISIGNKLAVRNTVFLRHLCDSVSYLAPLVQAVRLWMKHWKLAGSMQAASPLLNNYAVTLLVLFYLYEQDYILTLEEMRAKVVDFESCIIENWDCSFSEISSTRKKEASSVTELFSGFFHFYGKFDFAKHVLCLKNGKPEDLTKFKEQYGQDTKLRGRTFKFGALNIQDPFELDHNVAGNVGQKHMLVLTKCMRNAALACDMKIYGKKPGDPNNIEPWGILNLFIDHHVKKLGPSPKNSFSEKSDHTIEIKTIDNNFTQNQLIKLLLTILEDVFFVRLNPDEDIEVEPQNIDKKETAAVSLRKFSKVENNGNKDSDAPDSRKRHHDESPVCQKRTKVAIISSPEALNIKNKASEIGFNNEDITFPMVIECEVLYKVWEGRRKARRHLVQPGKGDILDLERQVSKLLLSEASAQETTDPNTSSSSIKESMKTYFRFVLTVSNLGDKTLSLTFRILTKGGKSDQGAEQDFQNFYHHLETFLPNTVSKCLKVG